MGDELRHCLDSWNHNHKVYSAILFLWKPEPVFAAISATSTYTVGNNPFAIAIDSVGNVWVTNNADNTVTELNSSGSLLGTFHVGTQPRGIAIDPNGNIWVANSGDGTVTVMNSSGAYLNGTLASSTFTVGTGPHGIAIETTGNVWVTNFGSTTLPGNTITQLCGVAAVGAKSVVNGVTCKNVGQQAGTFTVGKNPEEIIIDFWANVWVANYYDNTLTVWEGATTGPHFSPYSGPIWP